MKNEKLKMKKGLPLFQMAEIPPLGSLVSLF
jgi:hypothetical protein